jgi:hypothetical protein
VVGTGGVAGEDGDAVPGGQEPAFEDGADIAGSARDDDLHGGTSFPPTLPSELNMFKK